MAGSRTPQTLDTYRKFGLSLNPWVFFVSAILIVGFSAWGIIFHDRADSVFSAAYDAISENTGWLFILAVDVFLVISFYIMCSRHGTIRLGGADATPDFSYWQWLAMLFSAGMGIGLVFWSVAEPMKHFAAPPIAQAESARAAQAAMKYTYFHWGLHAWGIYALIGLGLAFFCFNRGLPLTVRSLFHPILKDKINGPIGNLIDILAVVATLFGVATSLGFGVQQVNAGLHHVVGIPIEPYIQVILIALITSLATLSVVLGLDKGVRRLSEINMFLAAALLIFVFLVGPTLFLLNSIPQNIGTYLGDLIRMSSWTETYNDQGWQNGWTVFYWAWWIAWSPFVGMFIARISRGRTIRQFMAGVLLVPTLLTFVWLSIFGNAALFEELHGNPALAETVARDGGVAEALFVLLNLYPLATISSILGIIVIVLFFVTSSDSGSLVIDIITAGGNTEPPVVQRIFWAAMEGVVAAVLLLGGGLGALQTASVVTGLPFMIVLLVMTFSLLKGLKTESIIEEMSERDATIPPDPVQGLTAPHHGRNWVFLDWNIPADGGQIAAYRIWRKGEDEQNWKEVGLTTQPEMVVSFQPENKTCEYRITALNRMGESAPSESILVRLGRKAQDMTRRKPPTQAETA